MFRGCNVDDEPGTVVGILGGGVVCVDVERGAGAASVAGERHLKATGLMKCQPLSEQVHSCRVCMCACVSMGNSQHGRIG